MDRWAEAGIVDREAAGRVVNDDIAAFGLRFVALSLEFALGGILLGLEIALQLFLMDIHLVGQGAHILLHPLGHFPHAQIVGSGE